VVAKVGTMSQAKTLKLCVIIIITMVTIVNSVTVCAVWAYVVTKSKSGDKLVYVRLHSS
jgi:hypothetical protein